MSHYLIYISFYFVLGCAHQLHDEFLFTRSPIPHFTVVQSANWPLIGCEAEGDFILIQTSPLLHLVLKLINNSKGKGIHAP